MGHKMDLRADENGMVGAGVKYERIRRITGYLVGTVDRFNNAKRAEVGDRVLHGVKNEDNPLYYNRNRDNPVAMASAASSDANDNTAS